MKLLWAFLTTNFFVTTVHTTCSDCAYRGCHPVDNSKLNVHLIAHTHDDAGWLKTADQYFYGGSQHQAEGGVQYIIDSVIGELDADDSRRFIWAETLFLWRWWNDRPEHVRYKVKKFIEEGRLQLVNGGWVMSDEATPHYTMLIDQMSLGVRFLKEIFGQCGIPKIAWQIDPFGHSSELGHEFSKMGFDAVFFGRINQDDYIRRKQKKEMEMIWRPYKDESTIFTGVLFNLYQPPDGFCFDVTCKDEPIMDNPQLHGYNMERRISSFVARAHDWAAAYRTNHVQLTMGGDFHFMVASSWFVNLDKIIRHVNERYPDINVIYSTPACYVKALNDLNTTWPIKENDDFFPYASYENRYWTGYYSSRLNFKYLTARTNNLLQVVKKVGVFSSVWNSFDELEVERSVALAQHHDAIAGTERSHVSSDYALYLWEAIHRSKRILTNAYRSWGESSEGTHSFCMLRNISECHTSERSRRFILYVFNPLAQETSLTIRLPSFTNIQAYERPDLPLIGDLMPIPMHVMNIPGRHSSATQEYVFQAERVPPMGFKSFYVQQQTPILDGEPSEPYTPAPSPTVSPEITVGFDEGLQIIMNAYSGLLQYIVIDENTWFLEQRFGYYDDNHATIWSSGAYTFAASNGPEWFPNAAFTIHRGVNVIEVHQVIESWVSQVIRLHRGRRSIEFEWLVGPVDVKMSPGYSLNERSQHELSLTYCGSRGKDIISYYKTHLATNGVFYTDSNGRKFMTRRRGYHGHMRSSSRIEANYYPVTTAARIHDHRASVTVLTDRAQGASSTSDGTLEFMIHRRHKIDDGKGVTEPLNDVAFGQGIVTRGSHIVHFTENSKAAYLHRTESLAITQGPWLSIVSTSKPLSRWIPKSISFLRAALPENVNVLTLQKLSPSAVLLRLEHIFDINEDKTYSSPIGINLSTLFTNRIKSVKEVTLDGSSNIDCNLSKLNWGLGEQNRTRVNPPSSIVILEPMEIRTFIVYFM